MKPQLDKRSPPARTKELVELLLARSVDRATMTNRSKADSINCLVQAARRGFIAATCIRFLTFDLERSGTIASSSSIIGGDRLL